MKTSDEERKGKEDDDEHGVGGVMVSIVAFQAVDPGSTPGRRTFCVTEIKEIENIFV